MSIARKIQTGSLFLLFVLQACAAIPPEPQPPPAEVYSRGVLQTTYESTLFRTFEAARATLQEQEMAITSARRDADTGSLQAVLPDGTPVNLAFRAVKPDRTEIGIKVGEYGSEEISRNISRGIEAALENP